MYSHGDFNRNPDQARRTALDQLRIILANEKHLRSRRDGKKLMEAARSMKTQLETGGSLSPKQYSYVDGIYEKMMAAAGHDAVPLHVDKKRKGLKYG